MNAPQRLAWTIISLLACETAQAQVASAPDTDQKDKIQVELSVLPTSPVFRAGVLPMAATPHKVRLWVANAEERKCTITISNAAGTFWQETFNVRWYAQILDFSALEDDVYTIRVSNGKDNFERQLLIQTHSYVERKFEVEER